MTRHLSIQKQKWLLYPAYFLLCIGSVVGPARAAVRPGVQPLSPADSTFLQHVKDTYGCPCGCGNELPGSRSTRTCFGCSVGKAEISRLEDGLRRGETRASLLMALTEEISVDVFADYTDRDLPRVWSLVRRVTEQAQVHRVVMRTPGRTRDARRAVALAECARDQGLFFGMQERLVQHMGPWDEAALISLAAEEGLDTALVFDCLQLKDVGRQVAKDQQHATERGLHRLPAVSVNRQSVRASQKALREALREAIASQSY